MLLLGEHGTRMPPIVSTVASEGSGVDKLVREIDAHRAELQTTGDEAERRRRRLIHEVQLLATSRFQNWLRHLMECDSEAAIVQALSERAIDPVSAANELVQQFAAAQTTD
jgi:LAO/AO transport system kinase